jgi:AraC family transcriptional regulator
VRSSEAKLARDPMVEALGCASPNADRCGGSFGQVCVNGVGVAVARFLISNHRTRPAERRKPAGLPQWRLKRAIDYIDARLAEPVTLADIAASTGLTRMHFAAQFRAATGLRPHEYLLRRRIKRAQELIAKDGVPLVDVALSVGFQTQSHFTSVFKRFVGQPPHAWRQSQRDLGNECHQGQWRGEDYGG